MCQHGNIIYNNNKISSGASSAAHLSQPIDAKVGTGEGLCDWVKREGKKAPWDLGIRDEADGSPPTVFGTDTRRTRTDPSSASSVVMEGGCSRDSVLGDGDEVPWDLGIRAEGGLAGPAATRLLENTDATRRQVNMEWR